VDNDASDGAFDAAVEAGSVRDAADESRDAADGSRTDAGGGQQPADDICDLSSELESLLCDRFERTIPEQGYQAYKGPPRIVRDGARYRLDVDAPSGEQLWLERKVVRPVTRVQLAFTMEIATWPASGVRQIMPLRFQQDDGSYALVYLLLEAEAGQPQRMGLWEQYPTGSPRNTSHRFDVPGPGEHVYRIEVDLNASRAQVWIDGAPQLPAGEAFPQLARYGAGNALSLMVGATYPEGADTAVRLRFDSIALAADGAPP
jgi:hypothetical protein